PGPSDGPSDAAGVRRARVGSGTVLLGDDLDALLAAASVPRETLVDAGLGVVRRRRAGGTDWLIVNPGDRVVDGWVPLADRPGTPPVAAALFDPMSGRTGVAELRRRGSSPAEARLRLEPGQSVVVRGYDTPIEGPAFPYFRPGGPPRPLAGTWRITFRDGGPSLPPPFETDRLTSWTERGDTAATRAFSGLATYTLRFPRPEGAPARWRLDLGDVRESARVRMNGHDLGVLIGPGYHVDIDPALLRDTNTLEVDVASLMANRVAAMDRRGEGWKRFYNVNFPARLRENVGPDGLFDASGWPPLPSGLLGPVTLTPMERP
ncbi:MAG: glycoside hydrolase family 2 protein, partial [Gemmatimonadota bacterium]